MISGSQEKIADKFSVAPNKNNQAMANTIPTLMGALPTENELSISGFVINLFLPSESFLSYLGFRHFGR